MGLISFLKNKFAKKKDDADVETYSKGMEKHKIGDNVSLEELMKYSVTYSDNTAHHMLLDFIGKTEIKNYALGLGAKYILNGWDDFGNQSASDLNIYLNKTYRLRESDLTKKLLNYYYPRNNKNKLMSFLNKRKISSSDSKEIKENQESISDYQNNANYLNSLLSLSSIVYATSSGISINLLLSA